MSKPVQAIVEATVQGLGYELVDVELAGRGLLRVFIDVDAGVPSGQAQASVQQPAPARVAVQDCERVSRQLTRVFEVEGVDYARLEVSSPGLDRPLKKPADFERFAGCEITLRLKQPIDGRRNFEGPLASLGEGRFELQFEGKGGPSLLAFVFDDVDRARLVPKVEF